MVLKASHLVLKIQCRFSPSIKYIASSDRFSLHYVFSLRSFNIIVGKTAKILMNLPTYADTYK